jgi:hypothetical protein
MTQPKKPALTPSAREAVHDARTEMVLAQVARENAEMDARTKRLKALRLAKEAQDAAAPQPAPAPRRSRKAH